jgi:NitT/TauT family transport system ATP-binding protein
VNSQVSIAMKEISFSHEVRGERIVIFDSFSLTIGVGEVLGVFGESGVGKTTLLSIISGETLPESGSIISIDCPNQDIGYLRQSDTLLPFRNVRENVELLSERAAQMRGIGKPDPTVALARIGLVDRALGYPEELSGGMRQRLQLAQCLMSQAALMLLDEPFSQQDLATQIKLEEWLSEIVREDGISAVIVSHDLSALASLCNRVLVLGGHPASIHSSETIDSELGSLSPANRRKSKDFSPLMTKLWKMRLAASQC